MNPAHTPTLDPGIAKTDPSGDCSLAPHPHVLEIDNLHVSFSTVHGVAHAVKGVSLNVPRGKTVALVGESGSGKSVTSFSILRLIQPPGQITGGAIRFYPKDRAADSPLDLATLPEKSDELFGVRGGRIGMIFQEPMTALSPVHTVGNQVMESLRLHENVSKAEAYQRSVDMLERVKLTEPRACMSQYPFELSGGMRQRVVIAMALIARPEVLIADEPTTALDVTVQAEILELINELKRDFQASVIFITHDLGVVAQIADQVAVMQHGEIVETGDVRPVVLSPRHPYTQKLMDAMPRFDPPESTPRISVSVEGDAEGTQAIQGDSTPLLRVRRMRKVFRTRLPGWRRRHKDFIAVDDVSFNLHRGETYGVVGESGSGKTTLARCVLRALQPTSGEVLLQDGARAINLARIEDHELTPLRKRMQMVFQDPFSSLNPRMSVLDLVAEPLRIHKICGRAEQRDRVVEMLERVGLDGSHLGRYPHAFSGGQRQRISIARALILKPALVVADESVSALDVTVQAQVLDLLKSFQDELGLAYIFVSHDLSVVRAVCDRIAVMHRGRVVETGPAEEVFANPQHPYTQVLLSAIPHPDPDRPIAARRVSDLTPQQLEPLPSVAEAFAKIDQPH